MKLTDKELEIMAVLWRIQKPMTASELIEISSNRTWKENSIYIIMNTLIKKGAVALTYYKPTGTNTARAYEPKITSDEYTFICIENISQMGIDINLNALIERLNEKKG